MSAWLGTLESVQLGDQCHAVLAFAPAEIFRDQLGLDIAAMLLAVEACDEGAVLPDFEDDLAGLAAVRLRHILDGHALPLSFGRKGRGWVAELGGLWFRSFLFSRQRFRVGSPPVARSYQMGEGLLPSVAAPDAGVLVAAVPWPVGHDQLGVAGEGGAAVMEAIVDEGVGLEFPDEVALAAPLGGLLVEAAEIMDVVEGIGGEMTVEEVAGLGFDRLRPGGREMHFDACPEQGLQAAMGVVQGFDAAVGVAAPEAHDDGVLDLDLDL